MIKLINFLIRFGKKYIPNFKEIDISDSYHTFDELQEFRKQYNAALFNEWARTDKYRVHKSERHHDNEVPFGGGWFIVVANLPTGQISNHYKLEDWGLFNVAIVEKAIFPFDGHSSEDVLDRLEKLNLKR